MIRWFFVAAVASFLPSAAAAEVELSAYLGAQTASSSEVSGDDPGGLGVFSFDADWEGRSFEMPPYWGVRATWWRPGDWGIAIESNHAKVYASDDTLDASGFDGFELTHGLNLITVNYMRRYPSPARVWTPYWGVGLGVAAPHVEVTSAGGKTSEYQITGPAVIAIAGASYRLNDRWSLFGEGKLAWSSHEADLDNGGEFETEIFTQAVNVGVSWHF